MKKSFPLSEAGKDPARVRDKIRHDVNRYVRRERRKTLPEGFDGWDLSCRVGPSPAASSAVPVEAIGRTIDAVAEGGASSVYIEIIALPGIRPGAARKRAK